MSETFYRFHSFLFINYTVTTVHPSGTPLGPVVVHVAAPDFMNVPDAATPCTQLLVYVDDGSVTNNAFMLVRDEHPLNISW